MDNILQFEKIERDTYTLYRAFSKFGEFAVRKQNGILNYVSYWYKDCCGNGLKSVEDAMLICQNFCKTLQETEEKLQHCDNPIRKFFPQYDPIIVELGTNQKELQRNSICICRR